MLSISHSADGSFRLEIHGSPSELSGTGARRLRAVLLGLAREVETARDEGERPDDGSGDRSSPPPARRGRSPQREAS